MKISKTVAALIAAVTLFSASVVHASCQSTCEAFAAQAVANVYASMGYPDTSVCSSGGVPEEYKARCISEINAIRAKTEAAAATAYHDAYWACRSQCQGA